MPAGPKDITIIIVPSFCAFFSHFEGDKKRLIKHKRNLKNPFETKKSPLFAEFAILASPLILNRKSRIIIVVIITIIVQRNDRKFSLKIVTFHKFIS